ncbi:MAG: hypothetical protein HY083_10430 [Gammaproteobacteria bacterium]|nr:hypothetical protein [Gammaproteobacteria bacterium]
MPAERSLPLLLALALCQPVAAAEPATATTGDKTRAKDAEVSLELLEFLGSWETATGPWNEAMTDTERAQPTRRPKESARE